MNELQLIDLLRKKIPRRLQGRFGIGDDAAVLPGLGVERWLFTTDSLVEGVDFLRRKTPARLVGRKALAVNLSDIAAMGGTPAAFVVSLGLPKDISQKWIEDFYAGMIPLARKYQVLCVGGDISRSHTFFVSIAMLGKIKSTEIVSRRGAKPGNLIAVTGKLGGSIFGHHLKFEPRIPEARFLAARFHPTAMLDLSDGLVLDLGRILKESGVGAEVDLARIPVSPAAKNLESALTDGEDFELLLTLSAAQKRSLEKSWKRRFPQVPLSWIGKIIKTPRKILWRRQGQPVPAPRLKQPGFTHF